jgi:diaminopimelate epimerase
VVLVRVGRFVQKALGQCERHIFRKIGHEGHRQQRAIVQFQQITGAEILNARHKANPCAVGDGSFADKIGEIEFIRLRTGKPRARHKKIRALQGFGGIAIAHILQVGDEFVLRWFQAQDFDLASIACQEGTIGGNVRWHCRKALKLHGTADAMGAGNAADEDVGVCDHGPENGWIRWPFPHIRPAMSSVFSSAKSAPAAVPFRKMNGLGNDFVVLDARPRPISLSEAQARAIADRKTGIGCDQVIVMEKSTRADVTMRIWNAEGGEVESCGNASRCIADLVMDEKGASRTTIDTKGGFLTAERAGQHLVTIDQGLPRFDWKDIPLSEAFPDTRHIELQVGPIDKPLIHSPSVVNVGNPHCIFWVDSLDVVDLGKVGPMIEHHPLFPQRTNVELAQVVARDHIILKVWERGAGLTKACGTAACAVMAAGYRLKLIDASCRVTLPGGDLLMAVNPENGHVLMTGPVAYEFEGVLPERFLA